MSARPAVCLSCGRRDSLQICSGCLAAAYCSEKCQREDWEDHLPVCTILHPSLALRTGMIRSSTPPISLGSRSPAPYEAQRPASINYDAMDPQSSSALPSSSLASSSTTNNVNGNGHIHHHQHHGSADSKTYAQALESLGVGKDLVNNVNLLKHAVESKDEAAVALMTQGGYKQVVSALDMSIDATAALACLNLAVEVAQSKLQSELVDEGVGLVLCKILKNFVSDPRVCESACKLVRVSSDESRLKSVLFVQGCGKACIACLQRHPADMQLARQALWAMHSLAWCETNKPALMQHGAGVVVLQAMRTHVDVHVQHQGCCVIASLAFAVENRQALFELGAGPTVLAAIKAFPKDVDVVKNGAAALVGLTFDASSKVSMFNAGTANVVLSALATHNTNPKVAQHCCLIIANLSCDPSLRQPLLDLGALALVRAASRLAPKESRNASYKLGGSRN